MRAYRRLAVDKVLDAAWLLIIGGLSCAALALGLGIGLWLHALTAALFRHFLAHPAQAHFWSGAMFAAAAGLLCEHAAPWAWRRVSKY